MPHKFCQLFLFPTPMLAISIQIFFISFLILTCLYWDFIHFIEKFQMKVTCSTNGPLMITLVLLFIQIHMKSEPQCKKFLLGFNNTHLILTPFKVKIFKKMSAKNWIIIGTIYITIGLMSPKPGLSKSGMWYASIMFWNEASVSMILRRIKKCGMCQNANTTWCAMICNGNKNQREHKYPSFVYTCRLLPKHIIW